MGSVPDRFEVIRQVRWAGRRFYLAHDWQQERRVYLIQCWAGVDAAAYNYPGLPVVEALPDTDGEWLLVRPINGESLAEMRTEGRLTAALLGDLLLAAMDGLAYLGRMVPSMVPAYVDPRFIKMGPDGWVVDYVAAAIHSSDARWSDGVMPVAYPMGGLINWLFTGKGIQVGLSRPRTGWIPPWISPDLQAIMRRCLDRAYADPEDLRRDLIEVVEGNGLQGLAEKLCPEPKKERRQSAKQIREDEESPRDAAPRLDEGEREASAAAEEPRQSVAVQNEGQPESDLRKDMGEQPQPLDGGEDRSEPAAAAAESQPAEEAAEQTRPRVRRKVEGLRGTSADLARLQSLADVPQPAPDWGEDKAPAAPPEPAAAREERPEPAAAGKERPGPAPAEPVRAVPQAKAHEKTKPAARVVRLGGPSKKNKPQSRPRPPVQAAARASEELPVRPAQSAARSPQEPLARPIQSAARASQEPPVRPVQEPAWHAEAPRSVWDEPDVREARETRASREDREARESRAARNSRKAGNGKRQSQERFRWITLIAGTLVVVLMVWFGVQDIQARIAAARGENLASRDRQNPSSQVQEPPRTTTTNEPNVPAQPSNTTKSSEQRNQEPSVTKPGKQNQEQPTTQPGKQNQEQPTQTEPKPPTPQEQEPATPTQPNEENEKPSGPAPIPAGYDYAADKAAGGMPLEVVVDGTTLGTFYIFPSPTDPRISLHAINRFLNSNLYWEGVDLETVRIYEGNFSLVTQDYSVINDRLWVHLTPEIQNALGLRVTGYKDGRIQFTTR